MSSAFRNFFLTFLISIIAFSLLGWFVVYPALDEIFNLDAAEISGSGGDDSGDDSFPSDNSGDFPIIKPEDKRIFTSVFVGLNNDGTAASVIYLRANENTSCISYSFLSVSNVKGVSEIGVKKPLKTLFNGISYTRIPDKISGIVGMPVSYYAVFGIDELVKAASYLSMAKLTVYTEIKYIKPEYEPLARGMEEQDIPDYYWVVVEPGLNDIDEALIRGIAGAPDASTLYESYLEQMYATVFNQVMTEPATKGNISFLYDMFGGLENTNITALEIEEYSDLVFKFGDSDVKTKQVAYPQDYTKASKYFKEADAG